MAYAAVRITARRSEGAEERPRAMAPKTACASISSTVRRACRSMLRKIQRSAKVTASASSVPACARCCARDERTGRKADFLSGTFTAEPSRGLSGSSPGSAKSLSKRTKVAGRAADLATSSMSSGGAKVTATPKP